MPRAASLRECREELGVVPDGPLDAAALLLWDDGGAAGFNVVFLVDEAVRHQPTPDPAAATEARYWPTAALPPDRVPWLDNALRAAASTDGSWYGEPF